MTDAEAFERQVAEEYARDAADFGRRTQALGYTDLEGFYWYHTIDLPGGLVTPGQYDFRQTLPAFHFAEDMRGMNVLDVGSATGFFAFEFERRGASVVSVELPSLMELDRFPGQSIDQIVAKIEKMMGPKALAGPNAEPHLASQLYRCLLGGPFDFCARMLGSKVDRCYSTVYRLGDHLEKGSFDFVFMGDILLHTLHPLEALAAVAPLCRGSLVVSQVMPDSPDGRPALLYVGGDSLQSDEVSWWWPNQPCLTELLLKLGFRQVVEVGHHTGVLRPSAYPFDRTILRADK